MPPRPLASRVVTATEGGIRNDYIALTDPVNSEFFPPDSVGARNRRDPGKPLRIWFAGLDGSIDADIDGEHKSLRARSPQKQFFNINGIGDNHMKARGIC